MEKSNKKPNPDPNNTPILFNSLTQQHVAQLDKKMSDEESDQEYFLDPSREPEIRANALKHFDFLTEKTINFEELLNELVHNGALSFEEKFKIQSGIVDETTANTTIPEKCNELYQTILVKRQVPLCKLFKCWEETGNTGLVGRFDTHFCLEGRDSKSLKFNKFKALPSHRTEFLTHLHLKQLQLSPKALLKCLRKSTRLVSIQLERIKVPYGGRGSDDPASDFDQPLLLPNLKEFYFEEVSKKDPFKTIKEVNVFLDELNLKPMLFFGLNSNMAWDAGIKIEVKMRGSTIFKMWPFTFPSHSSAEFVSMLRRRPVEYGGFINPPECPKISLYESYIPKSNLAEGITHLIIYRCKVSNFDPLLSKCPNLTQVTLYGEHETNNIAQIDLSCFAASRMTLKSLTIGYTSIFFSNYWDKNLSLSLSLSNLSLDCCLIKVDFPDFANIFDKIDKLLVISCQPSFLHNFLSSSCGSIILKEIQIYEFLWEEEEEDVAKELITHLSKHLLKKDTHFVMEKVASNYSKDEEDKPEDKDEGIRDFRELWKPIKSKEVDFKKVIFQLASFSRFVPEEEKSSWFDLPFKNQDGSGGSDEPRRVFREAQGY